MNTCDVDTLNSNFALHGRLSFETGPGDFIFARITPPSATAQVCLHGGHVTAFQPTGQEPVIWTSPAALYRSDKAIRGGIPICWPWFGDHPSDPALPAHGFARTSTWEVCGSSEPQPGAVKLELALPTEDAQPRLSLAITVSNWLTLELVTVNRSDSPFDLTAALHTYLHVGDISLARIVGLDGVRYLDKMDGFREKSQTGDVVFEAPTDRIYENATGDALLHDPSLDRAIRVSKTGSRTWVVWNPWAEGARKMSDMPDDDYRNMLCVEAANTGSDVVTLAPGASHTLSNTLSL